MESDTGDPVLSTASSSAPVAAIVALELERTILERSRRKASSARNESGLVVYCSGPGPARAESAARRAIEAGASALLSFGIAGGLRAGVETGTVVLPHTVVDASGAWTCDAGWCAYLESILGRVVLLTRARLVSLDHVATSVAEKRLLASSHDAAAVDMESAAIARAAERAGLPFAALRAVADAYDDALPPSVETLVTADGRTHLPALFGLLAAPRDLPALIRLGRRSGRARAALARVADVIVRAGEGYPQPAPRSPEPEPAVGSGSSSTPRAPG